LVNAFFAFFLIFGGSFLSNRWNPSGFPMNMGVPSVEAFDNYFFPPVFFSRDFSRDFGLCAFDDKTREIRVRIELHPNVY
jgi:hypothetical protein